MSTAPASSVSCWDSCTAISPSLPSRGSRARFGSFQCRWYGSKGAGGGTSRRCAGRSFFLTPAMLPPPPPPSAAPIDVIGDKVRVACLRVDGDGATARLDPARLHPRLDVGPLRGELAAHLERGHGARAHRVREHTP